MTKSTMLVVGLLLGGLTVTGFRNHAVISSSISYSSTPVIRQLHQRVFANVAVSGPWSLSMCDQGVWTASVSGASGPFTYEWYVTVPGNGSEPPATSYAGGSDTFVTYLDYWISFPDRTSINLTVDVYNSSGYVGSGYRTVYAGQCVY